MRFTDIPSDEVEETFFRAGTGAGGQHVNRTESAVRLTFGFVASSVLTEDQKSRLAQSAKPFLVGDTLVMTENSERSLARNREIVRERLIQLLNKALIPPKKRKKTRVPFAEKLRRKEQKQRIASKKKLRSSQKFD